MICSSQSPAVDTEAVIDSLGQRVLACGDRQGGSKLSKILNAPGGGTRIVAPTTTKKLAERMLSASREIAAAMPRGFYTPTPLDTLLTLYVAEDDAHYPCLIDLDVPGATCRSVVERWVAALQSEELIERRDKLLALSHKGHALVTEIIASIYAAQRRLD